MPTFSRRLRPQQRSRLTPNENLGTGDHPLACCVPPPRCMLHHHPSPVLPPNHKVFIHEVYPHKALHHVVSTQHVHFSTYISITTHTQNDRLSSRRRRSEVKKVNDEQRLSGQLLSCSAAAAFGRLDDVLDPTSTPFVRSFIQNSNTFCDGVPSKSVASLWRCVLLSPCDLCCERWRR